jgi:hypothetical protein
MSEIFCMAGLPSPVTAPKKWISNGVAKRRPLPKVLAPDAAKSVGGRHALPPRTGATTLREQHKNNRDGQAILRTDTRGGAPASASPFERSKPIRLAQTPTAYRDARATLVRRSSPRGQISDATLGLDAQYPPPVVARRNSKLSGRSRFLMTDIRCAAEIATLRAGVDIARRLNIALVQIDRNALPPDPFRGAKAEVDIIGDGLRIEAEFQQN